MSVIYDKLPLSFMYPENWSLSDEDLESHPQTVSVQSPDGGFWSLHLFSDGHRPQELAAEALRAMRQEYEDVEVEEIGETWDLETHGYHLHFYCLDLLIDCRILSFVVDDHVVLAIWQAEDREFDKLNEVFRAITFSLLSTAT